ncbi:MAG TPA: hypothetical protein VIT91_14810 [Chthoniobacterales bacterium]
MATIATHVAMDATHVAMDATHAAMDATHAAIVATYVAMAPTHPSTIEESLATIATCPAEVATHVSMVATCRSTDRRRLPGQQRPQIRAPRHPLPVTKKRGPKRLSRRVTLKPSQPPQKSTPTSTGFSFTKITPR